jgi:oligopeptide transport system permease protein
MSGDSTRQSAQHQLNIWLAVLLGIGMLLWILPWLSPHTLTRPDWELPSAAPSFLTKHFFGTDAIGRDVFQRTLAGGRVSMFVGLLAALIALGIGLIYGSVAGYCGGAVDLLMMKIVEILGSLPFLLLVVLLLSFFEPSISLLVGAIGAYVWLDLARIVRAQVMSLKQRDFVSAARSLGFSNTRILLGQMLPLLWPLALLCLSVSVPQAILMESFLSFLGLSPTEASSSLGGLLAEGVQDMEYAPWTLIAPAVVLALVLLSIQGLADSLKARFSL